MGTITKTEEIKTLYANSDGEVVDHINELKVTTLTTDVEPEFVKLYLNDIARLYDLPKVSSNLLYEILRFMSYDNSISLGTYRRESIIQRLHISSGTLSNALTRFCEDGILTRVSKSEFIVNPKLFGRGKWKDIKKLQLTLIYDGNGKTFHLDRTTAAPDID